MNKRFTLILCSAFIATIAIEMRAAEQGGAPQVSRGQKYRLTLSGAEQIPNFDIDSKPANIHTQGIYLTDQSLYVTGRLEREPKQALFLRFDRATLKLLDYLDITPAETIDGLLDHPGGFDYDGNCFWVPVAISRRHSSTNVVKISTKLDSPLVKDSEELAFQVDDHIGALAYDRKRSLLYGANWDTKQIYTWHPDGTIIERVANKDLIADQPDWALAVQDWKSLGEGTVLAGGYDKSPLRKPSHSKAVIQWLDLTNRKILDSIRLTNPTPDSHRPTREGMTLLKGHLYLLPGDLGEEATLYRYQLKATANSQ